PVQMDVKTTNPDGSAASVVLTMLQPALAANAKAYVMLNLAPNGTMPAAALNFIKLTDVVATITVHGKLNTVYTIDPSTALTQALAARKASYWLQGPQAVQARVDTPITGSFHVVIDITVFADGTSSIDFQFNNDYAMQPKGGEVVYDLRIARDGKVLFAQAGIDQVQYTTWSKIFYSNGPVQVNIQQDILALERTGAIQAYNLATGVSASTIAGDVASLSNGNFGILGIGKITRDMTGTGGRGDIGSQPDWMCNWLTTQNAGAAQFALAQAEAGGTIPWHLFNPKTGHYTTVVDYPKLYTGYNSNSSGGTIGLTQPFPSTVWQIDIGHEPDVAYVAYLMTGRR